MKNIRILHNPKAGEGNYSQTEIVSLFKAKGYAVNYASLKKKDWEKFSGEEDILIIAGGDGAVGKVVKYLLNTRLADTNYKLAILPLGSANNFAKSIGIEGEAASVIDFINGEKFQGIDIGRISGVPEQEFFLESTGIGLLSQLMKKIEKLKKKDKDAIGSSSKKMSAALEQLYQLVLSIESISCKINADGEIHTGKYLLAEITNIKAVGPNLCLAPEASPVDGFLNIALLPESERQEFASYVSQMGEEKIEPYPFKTLSAQKISIECERSLAHVDDELLTGKGIKELKVSVLKQLIRFLVP